MKEYQTEYGTIRVCKDEDELYLQHIILIREAIKNSGIDRKALVGLSGGSTPQKFYRWAADNAALSRPMKTGVVLSTSDERCVLEDSDESNFGNARRLLMDPIEVPEENRFPWRTDLSPTQAADEYMRRWQNAFGDIAFDLCFLGMGDDCHTASLWPQCPLITDEAPEPFAATEWPGRGWRLTITPAGLQKCARVAVVVTGEKKAPALFSVLKMEHEPAGKPAQILKEVADRTIWLVDKPAASELSF